MNRHIKYTIVRLLTAAVLAAAICFQSLAATARIAFSDPSTQVGQEFSVTMKFTSTSGDLLGDTDVMLAYDTSALEFVSGSGNVSGGTGAIRVKSAPAGATEAVTELKFKALKAGTTKITISSWEGYDNNGQAITVEREGSSTITVQGLETSSDDATLRSLQVSPGTLSPSFTPEQEAYTVEVGLETSRLTVSAEATNDSAVVSVEGGDDLQEGANTVVCKVTAEDGTTVKTYTLTVNKVEGGENTPAATVDGTTATEPEVLAELEVTAKKIRITALPDGVEVPAGLKESSIAIGDVKVPGWTPEGVESPEYCVLYGINEEGEQNFYRFDLAERTVQRYFADQNTSTVTDQQYIEVAEQYNSLVDDYKLCRMLMFGAAAVAVILLIALIVVARSGRSKRDGYDEPENDVDDKPARAAGGRKLTREELYMMGHEEDYEEEDDLSDEAADAYQPEPVQPVQTASGGQETERAGQSAVSVEEAENMERELAEDLAREAAAATKDQDDEDDEDDFEFFDL